MGALRRARACSYAIACACALASLSSCEARSTAPPNPSSPSNEPARARSTEPSAPSSASSVSSAATPSADAGAAPPIPILTSRDPLVALAVRGFADAVVSLPLGARRPKPVVIALHGNYDRPEWQCGTWRPIVGDRAFIVCPRGVARRDSPSPDDTRFTYTNVATFTAEVDAALAALRDRYGAFVDPGPMMWIGFSLGAIMAAGYVLREPSRFSRMVLIEGGEGGWGEKKFSAAGGQRVLWGCGQAGCVGTAKQLAARFERVKVPSRVVYGKGEGHSYTGAVAEGIKAEWEWLVEGDARWAP